MIDPDNTETIDRIGKDFTSLPPKEAFLALTTSATFFFLHYVESDDFDKAWSEWGELVRRHALLTAATVFEEMETAGNA